MNDFSFGAGMGVSPQKKIESQIQILGKKKLKSRIQILLVEKDSGFEKIQIRNAAIEKGIVIWKNDFQSYFEYTDFFRDGHNYVLHVMNNEWVWEGYFTNC